MKILHLLVDDEACGLPVQECVNIDLKHVFGVDFPCGRGSKILRNVVSVSTVVDLVAGSADSLLSDLMNNDGNTPPPDWEPCWCQ